MIINGKQILILLNQKKNNHSTWQILAVFLLISVFSMWSAFSMWQHPFGIRVRVKVSLLWEMNYFVMQKAPIVLETFFN